MGWEINASVGAPDEVSSTTPMSFEPGCYEVYAASVPDPDNYRQKIQVQLSGECCFTVPLTIEAKVQIAALRASRASKLHTALVAEGADKADGGFKFVFFYSGVRLHTRQHLAGIELVPLAGEISLKGLEDAVHGFLDGELGNNFRFSELAKSDYSNANPMFAVMVHEVKAKTLNQAEEFASTYAHHASTIFAIERGDRPRRVATFALGRDGFALFGSVTGYRGNLLSPMFSQSPAHQIERLLPILMQSRKASLLTELYAQAIGDRDRDFQHFRLWALIEQVAREWWEKSKPRGPLLHPDGSPILYRDGVSPKADSVCAQVHRYLQQIRYQGHRMLRSNEAGLAVVIEGTATIPADGGVEVVRLWDALRGALEWRNQVAHVGRFGGGSTFEAKLAERLYWDGPILDGFVGHLARQVLFQELENESAGMDQKGP